MSLFFGYVIYLIVQLHKNIWIIIWFFMSSKNIEPCAVFFSLIIGILRLQLI